MRRIEDTPEAPQFTKVDQQLQQGAGRAGVRRVHRHDSGLLHRGEGAAARRRDRRRTGRAGGLQKGDVIVEIAGQTIANIYDYTYALDVLKIGEPAKVDLYARRQEDRDDAYAGGKEVTGCAGVWPGTRSGAIIKWPVRRRCPVC